MKNIIIELENALYEYITATNTHNFKNVRECIDNNAVYWFSNKSCVSVDSISDYFNHVWSIIKDEKYEAKNVEWISVSETSATCIYNYHWEGYVDNELKSGGGRATNIFNKKDGKWILIHEHLSPFPN